MGRRVTVEVVRDVDGKYERPVYEYETKGVFSSTKGTHQGGPPPDPNPTFTMIGMVVTAAILLLLGLSAFQGCSKGQAAPIKQEPVDVQQPSTVQQSVAVERPKSRAQLEYDSALAAVDYQEIDRLIGLQPLDVRWRWRQSVAQHPEHRVGYLTRLQNTQQSPEQVNELLQSLEDVVVRFSIPRADSWRKELRMHLAEAAPAKRKELSDEFRKMLINQPVDVADTQISRE